MNERSNGSHPRRDLHVRTGLAAALFGGFAITMAACPGPTPHTETDGSGGEASTTSTTSTTSSSTTSSASTTSSSSSGMPCTTPAECPAPKGDCSAPTCDGTTCGFAPVMANTPCTDGGGKLCDGAGNCVACITAAQCVSGAANLCSNTGVHTAPSTCNLGVCELGKMDDCAAAGLICKPDGCKPCVDNAECGPPAGDCIDRQCIAGVCTKVSLPQGSGCLPPAAGTCNATGTCASLKYVFVTSQIVKPNFGGTAKADELCNKAAAVAGLGGTWDSWTSDSMGSTPWVNLTQSSAPYMLLNDQTVVANGWAGLTSGSLVHGINLDENQQPVVQPLEVWTGTNSGGNYANSACADWAFVDAGNLMGAVGIAGDATGGWTKIKALACSQAAHLYCFQH